MEIKSEDFEMGSGVKCPKCGSNNTYQYDTDEKHFGYDGTGHVNTDHRCEDCSNAFRLYTKFTYQITRQYTSQ